MVWVIDASVAVRWFIEDEADSFADEVLKKLIDQPRIFAIPELFSFEVFAVLMRSHPEALAVFKQGMIPILHGGIFRQPMTETLAMEADRFVKMGLTGYDACYVAMAVELKGTWITYDQKAHGILKKHRLSWSLTDGMPPKWDA